MPTENKDKISIAGEWAFALDGENCGIREKWFNRKLNDIIQLPGTTDEAAKASLLTSAVRTVYPGSGAG